MGAFWCESVTSATSRTGSVPASTPIVGAGWVWGPWGWLAGVAWQLQQPVLWALQYYKLFVALALVCVALTAISSVALKLARLPTPQPALVVAVCVACGALLAAGSTGWRAHLRQAERLAPELEGITWLTTVVVDDLPRATPQGWRFVARPDTLGTEVSSGREVALPSRLMLGWYAPSGGPAPRAGERWQFAVRLRQPHGLANPHGFDSELWLWELGVGATGYVRTGPQDPVARRLAPADGGLQTWRERVRAQVYAHVPDRRVAGVLAALVVGDQAAIDRADWDVFRTTGVAHLVAISGLHITLWAWLATAAVARLWRWAPRLFPVWGSRLLLACPAPVAAAWGGGVLALGYAVFSGWGVPAQRTVLMLGVVLALRQMGLRWPWTAVAGLAMWVVLAWDPWALWQPGFWLSFVAVGVLLASTTRHPDGMDTAPTHSGRDRVPSPVAPGLPAAARVQLVGGRLWTALAGLWRTQWRIGLALAPLSLVWFGQVSLVGLLANLVAIPWVTLVVTPLALAAVAVPILWEPAAWAVQGLVAVLSGLSRWPWAALTWAAPPPVWALAACAGGLLAIARLPWAFRALGLALALPALLHQPQRPGHGEFELLAADVGQGSAVLVRTANTGVLVDAGPAYGPGGDAGQRVWLPLLGALGESLSDVVLTHSDTDHIGGALPVLAAHPQARVWASFAPTALATAWADPRLLQGEQVSVRSWTRCEAGQHWERDGVHFDVLHPTPDLYTRPNTTNNLSCVLRVRGTSGTALLTGDLDAAHEALLVARLAPPDLSATVLMAPHHGSRHSSSASFLAAVQPRWVLVQAGYRNRYGHPAPEVVARYDAQGIRRVGTPECGAMRWHSAESGNVRCHRIETLRPWHWQLPGPHREIRGFVSDEPGPVEE